MIKGKGRGECKEGPVNPVGHKGAAGGEGGEGRGAGCRAPGNTRYV